MRYLLLSLISFQEDARTDCRTKIKLVLFKPNACQVELIRLQQNAHFPRQLLALILILFLKLTEISLCSFQVPKSCSILTMAFQVFQLATLEFQTKALPHQNQVTKSTLADFDLLTIPLFKHFKEQSEYTVADQLLFKELESLTLAVVNFKVAELAVLAVKLSPVGTFQKAISKIMLLRSHFKFTNFHQPVLKSSHF